MTPKPRISYDFDDHGWFRWHEPFQHLLLERKPTRCVEVGSWLGCSARFVANLIKSWNGHLDCIDTWGPWYLEDALVAARSSTAYERFCANVWHTGLQEVITPFRGTSREASPFFKEVDWVYIDGDHEYDSVKEDLNVWWPKVIPGGLLLIDDYGMQGVQTAWDEFYTTCEGLSGGKLEGQLVWIQKT